MTVLLMIRHGDTDAVGRTLSGRAAVPLNRRGVEQASRLAERLHAVPLAAVYTSPVERAESTARRVAEPHRLEVRVRDALTEIDFGAWTGKSIAELDGTSEFRRFNTHRAGTRPPEGEHIAEVQARMAAECLRIAEAHPGETVAVVSHADPIRAALGFFAGLSVACAPRLRLDPGLLSAVELTPGGATILCVNHNGLELPAP